MAKAPAFANTTIYLLSYRSSLICNNPQCVTVTVGAVDWGQNSGPLTIKIGEAAPASSGTPVGPRTGPGSSAWSCDCVHSQSTLIKKRWINARRRTAFPARSIAPCRSPLKA